MTLAPPWDEEATAARARLHAVHRVAMLILEGDEQAALDEAHRKPYPSLWHDAEFYALGWKAAKDDLQAL